MRILLLGSLWFISCANRDIHACGLGQGPETWRQTEPSARVQRWYFLPFVFQFFKVLVWDINPMPVWASLCFPLYISLSLWLTQVTFLVCSLRAAVSHVPKSHRTVSLLTLIHDMATGFLFLWNQLQQQHKLFLLLCAFPAPGYSLLSRNKQLFC